MGKLERWTIVEGPSRFRWWLDRLWRLPTQFRVVRAILDDVVSRQTMTVGIHQSVPITGTDSRIAFLGGRVYANGTVIHAWGHYDPVHGEGDLWILHVDDAYTGHYHSGEFREWPYRRPA